jgi:hypothetical protein
MSLGSSALHFSQNVRGGCRILRQYQHAGLGGVYRVDDLAGVGRARRHIARRNPALKSLALQSLDDGVRDGDILRGIANENRPVGDVHRRVSRRLAPS